MEEKTAGYDGHFLNIAIAYGRQGRDNRRREVDRGGREERDTRRPRPSREETIAGRLYTAHLPNPEPDLIIRTSGEERMSGFLLWQGAYSELIFMDVYWPAFRKIDLLRAIRTYQKRQRRMGKIAAPQIRFTMKPTRKPRKMPR